MFKGIIKVELGYGVCKDHIRITSSQFKSQPISEKQVILGNHGFNLNADFFLG